MTDCASRCFRGFYRSGSNCVQCQKGKFQDNYSHTYSTCKNCNAQSGYTYKTTPGLGSEHVNQCSVRECPTGRYADSDSNCQACKVGQYQDGIDQSSCKQCPNGSSTTTNDSCPFCPNSVSSHAVVVSPSARLAGSWLGYE